MSAKHKGKISHTLQPISIIPLIILGLLIVMLGSHFFTQAMYREVELGLQYVASNTQLLFDTVYPGDYELRGDQSLHLYKGEQDITRDYSLIDQIHEDTGLDITIFYQDTRILTTVLGSDGQRIIGTGAAETILNDVLYTGNAKFYNNALVGTETYFSYYIPLVNSDGTVSGMLFVGKPRTEVDSAVQQCLYPLIGAILITCIIMSLTIARYTKGLVHTLVQIRNYVTAVSSGNLDATLAESALGRDDELGEISYSIQNMHRSLRTLAEQDTLTGLHNRRCANRKLEQALLKSSKTGAPLCLALSDIDFFKKINDSYGHECGDIVLKQVAQTMNSYIRKCGFVARWGGEEFLIVLDQSNLSESKQVLEELRVAVSNLEIPYDGQTIYLTITIGLVENDGSGMDNLLRMADNALYEGKTAGRNRVIISRNKPSAQTTNK